MLYDMEIINNILKRLRGYPTGFVDSKNNKLNKGDTVKIKDSNNNYRGIILYDLDKKEYYIEKIITNHDIEEKLYSFDMVTNNEIIIEKELNNYIYNDYKYYKQYLDNNLNPLEFFKQILKFANECAFALTDEEYKYIQNYIQQYEIQKPEFKINVNIDIETKNNIFEQDENIKEKLDKLLMSPLTQFLMDIFEINKSENISIQITNKGEPLSNIKN